MLEGLGRDLSLGTLRWCSVFLLVLFSQRLLPRLTFVPASLDSTMVADREAELRAALSDLHATVVNWDTGEKPVFFLLLLLL